MSHEPLGDHRFRVLAADDLGFPLGGVNAPDLDGLHLDGSALLQIDDGLGIHDFAAGAVALAVMLFRVFYMGVLPDVKGVNAVMTAGFRAAVVNAAACHDVHVAVFADIKVIVHQLLDTGLGDDNGDVAGLAHRAVLYPDVDAGLAVRFAGDLNMLRGLPPVAAGVLSDVERPYGFAHQICDFFQQLPVYLCVHHQACTSLFSTGQLPSVSDRICGRISSAEPRRRIAPSPTTMTSSAREMIRS